MPRSGIIESARDAVTHLASAFVAWCATSGLRILLLLFLAIVATQVLKRVAKRLRQLIAGGDPSSERAKRADTLAGVVQTVGGTLILIASAMMILREVGVDVGPLIAAAGIGGLAFGFGAQTLVKDVITLRDMGGTVHVIPNSSVTVLSNATQGSSGYVVEVPLAEKADAEKAIALLKEVGDELAKDSAVAHDIVEPLEILGLEPPVRQPVIKARIRTRPRRQWDVGGELILRIRQRFREAGIELR